MAECTGYRNRANISPRVSLVFWENHAKKLHWPKRLANSVQDEA